MRLMRKQLLAVGLVLLSAIAAQAQVSASQVRPVGRKLEQEITIFADRGQEKDFAALLPLRYHVVEDDEVNAFAARTRNEIVVNRGLLDFVQNDNELAYILGHEIGHIVVGQMRKVELEQVQAQMAEGLPDIEVTENMTDEFLADHYGVILMDCAGFDTDASVQVVRRFINLRDPATRAILLPWLLDQSKVSADQAHLVEEVRRVAVSDMAERLREGNTFCGSKQTESRQQTEAKIAANEALAVGWIRTINTAAVTYSSTYCGFPAGLANLGPGNPATPSAADFIDGVLAKGRKNGYNFALKGWNPDVNGCLKTYFVKAVPVKVGTTSQRSFCGNQSGVIRFDPTGKDIANTAACAALNPLIESTQQTGEVSYLWIGRFSITFETESRKQQVFETVDALGIYSEEDFRLVETSEVEARKKLIREFLLKKYAGQGVRVLDVALKGIERQVFQEPAPQP